MKFVGVSLDFVQPIIIALDPSTYFQASDETHEVGTLLVGVSGDGRVTIHNHESFECGQEVEGFASISIKVVGRGSF